MPHLMYCTYHRCVIQILCHHQIKYLLGEYDTNAILKFQFTQPQEIFHNYYQMIITFDNLMILTEIAKT